MGAPRRDTHSYWLREDSQEKVIENGLVGWVEFASGRGRWKKSKYPVSTKAHGMKIQDECQNTGGAGHVMAILYFTDSETRFFFLRN